MSLLQNQDPRYWLAKIVAAPDKSAYPRKNLQKVVSTSLEASTAATKALSDALQDTAIVQGHQDEIDALLVPLTSRMSAYSQKYSVLQQSTQGQATVSAPDLKADTIELLTFSAATLDGVRDIQGSITWFERLFYSFVVNLTALCKAIYEALVGVFKTIIAALSTTGKALLGLTTLGFAGLGVYQVNKLIERRRTPKLQGARRRPRRQRRLNP